MMLRSLMIALLCLAAVAVAEAQKNTPKNTPKTGRKAAPACCNPQEAAAFSDKSLYQTEAVWRDFNGKSVKLSDYTGKIVITTMIFTTCRYACPQITADMRRISDQLPPAVRRAAQFVFITMDVERDLPAVLRAYADSMGIRDENWTFLHGSDADAREIAALLGINYKKMSDGSFSHSNVIVVLNQGGEIACRQTGLKTDPAPTVACIGKLAAPRAKKR